MQSCADSDKGRLVLVVGPSGAGKDTLIDAAREKYERDHRFFFPRRIITRPANDHEAHETVSNKTFEIMAGNKLFLLHWKAHGTSYGIPVEAGKHLSTGRCVVANVSRTVIAQAYEVHRKLRVIHVTADKNILHGRLAKRGRENPQAVASRLERASQIEISKTCHCDEVRNNGSVEDAAAHFIALLESYAESFHRV